MKPVTKTTVRLFIVGFLAALVAFTVMGCNQSEAVESTDYKKLPPGEGARRLQDTLKRRAEGKSRPAPLPANVSIDQQKQP